MTKVINLIAGPSAGKSTNALSLTGYLKGKRYNAEYVDEYAKGVVWDEAYHNLDDQIHLFGNQNHAMYRLLGKVDYIVTDSPLLLALHYVQRGQKKFKVDREGWLDHFEHLVIMTINQYDNVYFVPDRASRKFIEAGRLQSEERAKNIDLNVIELLDKYAFSYIMIKDFNDIINTLEL